MSLRVVSGALNMVPYLLYRDLMYGPSICVGFIRGIKGYYKGTLLMAHTKGP